MEVNLNKKNLTERIAFKLATKISPQPQIDNLYFVKMKFGIEVLVTNLSKIFFILIIAEFLGILKVTSIIMLSFAFIRRYAFGVHAKSSMSCTIITSICFFVGGYMSKLLTMENGKVLLIFFIAIILLYLYAPADTEARPLIGKKLRTKLKIKVLLAGFILMVLTFSINDSALKFCISYGVLCESITITPIIYKLLGRRYKNYEHYKKITN